jgi:hypothetical protein
MMRAPDLLAAMRLAISTGFGLLFWRAVNLQFDLQAEVRELLVEHLLLLAMPSCRSCVDRWRGLSRYSIARLPSKDGFREACLGSRSEANSSRRLLASPGSGFPTSAA